MSEIQVITDWQNANSAAQELSLIITISGNRFNLYSKDRQFHKSSESIGVISAYVNGLLDSKHFFKK